MTFSLFGLYCRGATEPRNAYRNQKNTCRILETSPIPECGTTLEYAETRHAEWLSPADVKEQYGSASILHGNRVVFNIAGNKYRLVVKIHYNTGKVYVRFIGSHAEYDKINAETI